MHHPRPLLLAMLVAMAGPLLFMAAGLSPILDGRLTDGDSYMWLLRVAHLDATGDWYALHLPYTNAPFGEAVHWGRPFDVVLWLGAKLGGMVVGFPAALWAWGNWIGPALLLAAVPVWSWGTRGILDGGKLVLSVALIVLLWRIGLMFAPARPDHHGFQALLFIALLGCLFRGPRWAAAAGVIGGIALWDSVEMLVAFAMVGTVLAGRWVLGHDRHARPVALFLAATLAVATAAVTLQRPPAEWMLVRNDQLGVVYLVPLSLATLAWTILAPLGGGWSMGRRLAATIGSAVVALVPTILLFPRVLAGPWGDQDAAVMAAWNPTIGELTPMLPTSLHGLAGALVEMGPILLAMGYCWAIRDQLPPPARRAVAVCAVGLAAFLPLSLYQVRWLHYAQILALLPWTLAIADGWERAGRSGKSWARVASVAVLVGGPALAGSLLAAALPAPARQAAGGPACDWAAAGRHLKTILPAGAIILSHSFRGPELVWFGNVRVVGAPFHGSLSFTATWDFFRAGTDEAARRVATERLADYALICPADGESTVLGAGDPASLYARLLSGHPPPWLNPVTLPGELAAFRLFRVDGASQSAPISTRIMGEQP